MLIKASLSAKWENADAIDTAVTASTGLSKQDAIGMYTISRFIPFNPVDKKTIAYCTGPDGKKFVAAKGAPQVGLYVLLLLHIITQSRRSSLIQIDHRSFR